MGGKIISEAEIIALRCCCGSEAVVFEKECGFYGHDDYTISFQSSVNADTSRSLLTRIENAFRVLRGQTAIYTEVTEDKERIIEFLEGALKIVKGES